MRLAMPHLPEVSFIDDVSMGLYIGAILIALLCGGIAVYMQPADGEQQ